ncbi:uncharacterized protein YerC [Streptomyces achromogenes]|uniref:hypothetical protein n=1 Tax=Streptomyces achromogenes TaxID=67255 RepID=UPI00278358DD|nr:hypothetical protein [Streptomyces achromogenes]MDQ0829518.1 uncharacterized protein YerC [Streptomyces achromogenes]
MSPRHRRAGRELAESRDQIAAMLRDGATYLQIKDALHVSTSAIKAVRAAHHIPVPPRAIDELPPEQQRAAIETRYPHVAAMLRDGHPVAEIVAAGVASSSTVYKVRAVLQLPGERRARTIAETLARYVQPAGDGHARWTGPTSRADGTGQPQLWAHNRRHAPHRAAFRAHHGRAPIGPVTATCTYPGCLAGPHLADRAIRDADRLYNAIFGNDTP